MDAFYWERRPDGPFVTLIAVAATYCSPDACDGDYDDLIGRAREPDSDDEEISVFKAELRQTLADPGQPAMFAMTEALPPDRPATLVLEIPEERDEQDLAAAPAIRISWLHRRGAPAGDPSALAAEAAEVELPAGRGHAYLFGEATVVSRLREVLAGRGLGQDQMSPKAYWGRGRTNASHGEPARDA